MSRFSGDMKKFKIELLDYQIHGVQLIQPLSQVQYMEVYEQVSQALMNKGKSTDRYVGGVEGERGERRHYKYVRLDGNQCLAYSPLLWKVYSAYKPLVEKVTGREVLFSPWIQSAITTKLYGEEGAEHGWHTDTNSVTLILSLNDGSSPFEFCFPPQHYSEGEVQQIPSVSNSAIVLRNDVWHRIPTMLKNEKPRLSVVFNYYHEGEITRPVGLTSYS
jgi:hypothetical protein